MEEVRKEIKDEKLLNCWEYMSCGRKNLCPAGMNKRLSGVHGGENGGRACWVEAGSFTKMKPEGIFARKYKDCTTCCFYKTVHEEEGKYIWPVQFLHRLMR